MSPVFAPVAVALLGGILLIAFGLVFRNRKFVLVGLPAPIALACWYALAAIPPSAEVKFCDMFGGENLSAARDLAVLKPPLMDGYFMSFKIPPQEFASRLALSLTRSSSEPQEFLRNQSPPAGWPAPAKGELYSVKSAGDRVLLFYDEASQTAYVSALFKSW